MAILHSNGEYVCFIGDDDGISRYAIDVVKYMSDNKIESLSCLNVKYVWPNVHGVVWNFSATLLIDSFSGRFEEVDCQKERKKIFRRACWPYVGSKMPRVYQGIVKRTILDEVYKVTGSFFPGPSPDIANSIAISFYITKHVYSDLPLIISGSSNNSAAGKGAKHAHIGELKDQKFLGKDVESKWDKRIPKYWTGSSIYAESTIKTLECIDKREEIKYYNFNYLYALMYIYHPTIRSLIREKMSAKAWLFFPLGCMDVIIIRFFHLVKNMFIRMFGRNLYMNIDNIERCEDVLSKEVSMKINVEKSILSKDDRS